MKKNKRDQARQKGYDSDFEYTLHNGPLQGCEYHTESIAYIREAIYEPDFVIRQKSRTLYIEAKGRFRTRDESTKYIWIASALKSNEELVFIFSNANKPMPGARKRKDGTKQSMKEWAEKNEFRYYEPDTIPKSWKRN